MKTDIAGMKRLEARSLALPVLSFILFLLFTAVPVFGTQPTGPEIQLSAFDQEQLIVDCREPLLIELSLSNPEAMQTRLSRMNAETMRKAHEEATRRGMATPDEQSSSTPLPVQENDIVLGDSKTPLSSLISFQLEDIHHKKVALSVRPLADSSVPARLNLNGGPSVNFFYGVDSPSLSALPPGKYVMRAILSASPQLGGNWHGRAVSNNLVFDLPKKLEVWEKDEENKRQYLYGRFMLLDKKYDAVEKYAERLQSNTSHSADAWELRGDAYFGKGDLTHAKEAYVKALSERDAWLKTVEKDDTEEWPRGLLDRLARVDEQLETRGNAPPVGKPKATPGKGRVLGK